MKLRTARITNFRCVEDSEEFTLNQVTCLVGKNESGKTTILQALYGLHPWTGEGNAFERDRDYPRRHLNEYEERHGDGEARVVETSWELEVGDKVALEAILGPASAEIDRVRIYKAYGGASTQTWDVSIDEKRVLSHVLGALPLHSEESAELAAHGTIAEVKDALEKMGDKRSERHNALLTHLNAHFKRGSSERAAIDVLHPRMPKFLYFSQYQRMNGQVSFEAVMQRKGNVTLTDEDRVFLAFCDLVGRRLRKSPNSISSSQ